MNTTELLDQFILEARECLEHIGRRLLDVERTPDDRLALDDLFRQVHTLKGNCGLFELGPLERLVHAAEDLLDRVRDGRLVYGPAMADALLEAMDCTAELVDRIASEGGRLPDDAAPRADALARTLRGLLDPAASAGADAPAAPPPADAGAPPAWAEALPAALRGAGRSALRYRPEPECFFKGEDPWRLALQVPGLLHLAVTADEPWPDAATFDPYRCNLVLTLVSEATPAALDDHFRYVPEQVERVGFAAAAPAEAPAAGAAETAADRLQPHLQAMWAQQCALLARPDISPGTVRAVRGVLGRLHALAAGSDPHGAEATLPDQAAALAAWAAAHVPGGARAEGVSAPAGAAAPGTAALGSAQPAPAGAAAESGALEALDARRPAGPEEAAAGGHRVVRVPQERIDRLMDLIGEMVVAKNALPYLAQRAEAVFQQRELAREIKAQYGVINRIAEDMQRAIMQVRMLPVGTVFQRFGRLVRDIGRRLGKDVRLVVEGEETEADKTMIEALADPLIHIVRNSLDHGLETPAVRQAAGKPPQGTLRVTARQEGDRVVLEIADDGAGVDTARVRAKAVERGLIPADRAGALTEQEALELLFLPGFSTAETVSDLSGRGVGMDVVRSAVERVNGTVEIQSARGRGTTVRLSLPLSMAVTHVMMVEAGGRRFGVPMDLIVETVRVHADDIHRFKQARTVVLRGRVVALRALHELLALDEAPRLNAEGEHAVLVVRHGAESVGLIVDEFHGASDIILKPLEGVLAGLTGFSGTALMGDGSVLMVLDPKELL